jgi:hypothetical protein
VTQPMKRNNSHRQPSAFADILLHGVFSFSMRQTRKANEGQSSICLSSRKYLRSHFTSEQINGSVSASNVCFSPVCADDNLQATHFSSQSDPLGKGRLTIDNPVDGWEPYVVGAHTLIKLFSQFSKLLYYSEKCSHSSYQCEEYL